MNDLRFLRQRRSVPSRLLGEPGYRRGLDRDGDGQGCGSD